MLDNLKIFITAAEHRSLTNAATVLRMTIATVSRRVGELEQQLGCQLFHRSNKGLTLTPAGQSYYQECAGFINELDLRLENLDRTLNSINGDLKVIAPTNIGSGPLDEFWQSFVSGNPGISLTIQLMDPADDVIAYQADIAICSGAQRNPSLVQKSIGYITPILVASSTIAEFVPEKISDLDSCPSIAAQLFSDWVLMNGSQQVPVLKKHSHISNDMKITLSLVKAGAGISLLPKSMVYRELDSGELIQVLPSWEGIQREIYLVWPYQRTLSIRATLFRDELIKFLHEQEWFNKAP